MKKFYKIFLIIFLSLFAVFYIYAQGEKKAIAKSVLRLHVVAESNSKKDQELKLKVRDDVLKTAKELFSGAENKKDALYLAEKNKDVLKKAARKALLDHGCNLPVDVEVGKCSFPLKVYDGIRLPSGIYDAVNIKIGKAEGRNWWCVMYPALCFSESVKGVADKDALKTLKEELGKERFELITDTEDKKIQIKFKILELF